MGVRSGVFALRNCVLAGCVLAGCVLAGCSFSGPPGEVPGDVAPGVDAPPIDAPPVDAPPVTGCPGGYQAITGLTSRYRLTGGGHYRERHDDCKDDDEGRTHLVVLDTLQESTQLRASYNQEWWVGAVQAPDQAAPILGWFQITGGALPAGLWAVGQPNDVGGPENNEQNVGLRQAGGLGDEPGTGGRVGLCECDGKSIDSTVEGYIPDTSD